MTDVVKAARPAAASLSRRLAGGSASAQSLLFTVLGEFVLPAGTAAWTSALVTVLAQLGVEEKTTRQAVMRTGADGWLSAERVGRRTRWHLTDAAVGLLADGAERIYSFRGSQSEWDGTWLVVLARVPEIERKARHLLQSRLSWAGLGALSPGTWIGPRSDRLDEVRTVLRQAGVADAQCFRAEHKDGDARAMIEQAWDLAAIAEAYRDFIATFGAGDRPENLMAAQVELVHRWRRFPQIDPAVPRLLLPRSWPGDEAAALFSARHQAWQKPALALWQDLNAE